MLDAYVKLCKRVFASNNFKSNRNKNRKTKEIKGNQYKLTGNNCYLKQCGQYSLYCQQSKANGASNSMRTAKTKEYAMM